MNTYRPVIGLEIHLELKTQSKMFCRCPADHFGKKPNSQVCPVCLGLPGALPVPNKKAIDMTIMIAKALNCQVNQVSRFDRKHYFYPDLPKGYQISQYEQPIASQGWLPIKIKRQNLITEEKRFRIQQIHLEEDTGKLIHVSKDTLVDFNRSGVPLVEIVTEPDFSNSDEVKQFLEELQVIIRYLGVSDADMEKGTMRLEPNISIKVRTHSNSQQIDGKNIENDNLPNYKVEVKNINSFRFVKQAIDYEIKRQIEILKQGKIVSQETRGFDEKKQATYSQRTKEHAHDYRYFPEPDIPPLIFSEEDIKKISIPELPDQKLKRYVKSFGLRYQDAFLLTRDKGLASYFEQIISRLQQEKSKLAPSAENYFQTIANLIINRKLSTSLSVDEFVKKALDLLTPKKTDEKMLYNTISKVVDTNKKAVEDYKRGKQNALQFLVGQVMKEMRGQVAAQLVAEKIKNQIGKQILKIKR